MAHSTGATKLLPKNDGITIIISAYTLRQEGLGVRLSDTELEEINIRRTHPDSPWKTYVSEESAMELNGTIEKSELTSKDCLVKFFEVGLNMKASGRITI